MEQVTIFLCFWDDRKWYHKGIDHLDQKERRWESAVVSARMRDAFKVYGFNMLGFIFIFLAKKKINYIGSGPGVINSDEKTESKL